MTPPLPKDKPDLRKKLHDLPHKPGVYLMRDRLNRVIYVGKARDLRKRVSQYFMESKKRTADPKTRALLESVWNLEWHTVRSEPEALLLEGKLIKEFRPKYNVAFRDDKRFLMVKVDMAEEWPRFRLARFKREDNARYFGPYADAGALRHTLRFMRKRFGILTFGRGAPTGQELKSSSFQVHLKISGLNPEEYRQKVEEACEFIAGQSRELLSELEAEMHKAAEKLDFERAAELRNMLEDLRATMAPSRRFTRFTRNTLPSTVLPEADLLALKDALQLAAPPKVMECFDISNISSTHIVASMVCFRDGAPDIANYRRYRIKTVDGQNDFASMAEVIRRRYSRILLEARDAGALISPIGPMGLIPPQDETTHLDTSPEFSQEAPAEAVERLHRLGMSPVRLPDLIIVDGGKGQLSSACKELQRLGLHELPIIGLAKEFEEIYRPGRPAPLLLPDDSGALRLLQRIRDEAHRFANGYHQLLMKRRIAESLLDDCPGVSATRKQALLQKFGSVARLRRVPAQEIAAIPGIGPRLAEQIVEFLRQR